VIVLGLDSATRTGFGLIEHKAGRETIVDSGVIDLSGRSGKRAEVIEDFARQILARVGTIDVVGIEDNYLDTNEDKANVVTLKALARMVGRWEQAWEAIGVDTVLVNPQKWAAGILTGLIGPRANRQARKKASGLWVKATFGLTPQEDEGDGIAIATFLARSRAFARRSGQAA
jgi:Holliday junction resolvasome RuvABC endonuclease subunit